MKLGVTCRQFIRFLADYLAGELPEKQRASFAKHLSICPPCVAYMNSYREAIRLGRAVLLESDEPVDESVPEKLVRAVLLARRLGR